MSYNDMRELVRLLREYRNEKSENSVIDNAILDVLANVRTDCAYLYGDLLMYSTEHAQAFLANMREYCAAQQVLSANTELPSAYWRDSASFYDWAIGKLLNEGVPALISEITHLRAVPNFASSVGYATSAVITLQTIG